VIELKGLFQRGNEFMSKKSIVLVIIGALLLTSLLYAGCGSEPSKPAGEPQQQSAGEPGGEVAEEFSWPESINIITPAVGTANHSLAVAWTGEFTADTGVKARVLPAPTGTMRGEWLETGQGIITQWQASDYIERMNAIDGYAGRTAGPKDMRLIYVVQVAPWGFMVRGDSHIKKITDIGPGTKLTWYPGSAFILNAIRGLLAYNNLAEDDVKLVEVGSYPDNSRVIGEGRSDVTFTAPTSDVNYEVAASPHGIRWLEIPTREEDPEAYDRYMAIQSGYIQKIAEEGHESAHGVRMDHAYQNYQVKADTSVDFVYNIVKWFDENYDFYKDKYVHAYMMKLDNLIEYLEAGAYEPLHEGTIKYLKEKGLWKDEYQVRQDKILALSEKYTQAFADAVEEADKQGIQVVAGNKPWLELLKQYQKDRGLDKSYGALLLEQ
jgi:TRAP transporter TAXI family solute receptor